MTSLVQNFKTTFKAVMTKWHCGHRRTLIANLILLLAGLIIKRSIYVTTPIIKSDNPNPTHKNAPKVLQNYH